jgi:uncharacterized protein YaeQ
MALKATIFKADLQIADMDRNYYADHSLTLARHPSETDERMMVRLLAFTLFAEEALGFGKGLCVDDVGLPDEKWTRKACGRAARVVIVSYGSRTADVWWEQNQGKLGRLENLSVVRVPTEATQALAAMAERTMRLQCTVQDGQVWITNGLETVHIEPVSLQAFKDTHANR